MNIIIDDMAKKCLDDIFYYNVQFSYENAIEIENNIFRKISNLKNSSYVGQYVPEIKEMHFRELLYKKSKHTSYRIVYCVFENIDTIHVVYIYNCKQNFSQILKQQNSFNHYYKF